MTPGRADQRLVQRHLAALRAALTGLRRHAGVTAQQLRADLDRIAAMLARELDDFEQFGSHVERWLGA